MSHAIWKSLPRPRIILDERYNVANTPTANGSLFNLGPPILYRVGLRMNFPAERP